MRPDLILQIEQMQRNVQVMMNNDHRGGMMAASKRDRWTHQERKHLTEVKVTLVNVIEVISRAINLHGEEIREITEIKETKETIAVQIAGAIKIGHPYPEEKKVRETCQEVLPKASKMLANLLRSNLQELTPHRGQTIQKTTRSLTETETTIETVIEVDSVIAIPAETKNVIGETEEITETKIVKKMSGMIGKGLEAGPIPLRKMSSTNAKTEME